jgi:hypothetical protein
MGREASATRDGSGPGATLGAPILLVILVGVLLYIGKAKNIPIEELPVVGLLLDPLGLVWLATWGVIVGALAARKNRDPWLWGTAGAFLAVLTLLVLAFSPYLCARCGGEVSNSEARAGRCPRCPSHGSGRERANVQYRPKSANENSPFVDLGDLEPDSG